MRYHPGKIEREAIARRMFGQSFGFAAGKGRV
jgi:hypothetical protein